MSLRVSPTGLRLTVPPHTPARSIRAFLRESSPWIEAQRAAQGPPPPPLADGDTLALLDDWLELRVRTSDSRRQIAVREGRALQVDLPPGTDPSGLVERWYRREARRILAPRAEEAAAALGVAVRRITVRDPTSRWGSCSSSGTLSFSWRLLLAPERVLQYVVVHEVCHLVRADHSPAFWALLASRCPDHASAREWLRDNGSRLHRGPNWRSVTPA